MPQERMKMDKEIIDEIAGNTDLLKFLREWIEKTHTLKTGMTYTSECGKYQISYVEYIPDGIGGIHPTQIRIHTTDNYFEVNQYRIGAFSYKQILYLFINCFTQKLCNDNNHKLSDVIALEVMEQLKNPLTLS